MVYRETEGALQQIAGQWLERYTLIQAATPGQERVPPVLIIVCDNTDVAEVFYRKISGETEEEVVTEEDVEEAMAEGDEENGEPPVKAKKSKKATSKSTEKRPAKRKKIVSLEQYEAEAKGGAEDVEPVPGVPGHHRLSLRR